MHGACSRACRISECGLRSVDLRERTAGFVEALDRGSRRTTRPFPCQKEKNGRYEQTDPAEQKEQSGEGTHIGMLTRCQRPLNSARQHL
jgi:hypothetical protein